MAEMTARSPRPQSVLCTAEHKDNLGPVMRYLGSRAMEQPDILGTDSGCSRPSSSAAALEEKCYLICVGSILRRTHHTVGAIREHGAVLDDMSLLGRYFGRALRPVGQR